MQVQDSADKLDDATTVPVPGMKLGVVLYSTPYAVAVEHPCKMVPVILALEVVIDVAEPVLAVVADDTTTVMVVVPAH